MLVFEYLKDHIPIRNELKFRIDGAIGIVSSKKNFMISYLNETGLDFFLCIDGHRNLFDIYNIFQSKYNVDTKRCIDDILDLTRDLQWNEIILLKKGKYCENL